MGAVKNHYHDDIERSNNMDALLRHDITFEEADLDTSETIEVILGNMGNPELVRQGVEYLRDKFTADPAA